MTESGCKPTRFALCRVHGNLMDIASIESEADRMELRRVIFQTMHDPEEWVLEIVYPTDGVLYRRVISPIRYGERLDRILALCLCREEPRWFVLNRCSKVDIRPASEYLMPVEMVEVGSAYN